MLLYNYKHVTRITTVILVTCLLNSFNIFAQQKQDSIPAITHKIAVMARVQKEGKILLRWAPSTPRAWQLIKKYGVSITRFTITRDKQTLPTPIEKVIGTMIAMPLNEWLPIIDHNDNAAIMAQALYGESFVVEGTDQLSAIVNLSEEQQQRFTWGLYAADQNFITAEMAGLGYTDTDIKNNEKYIYKINSLVPKSHLTIEDGGVFTGLQDYEKLPVPFDLTGLFTDKKTMLSWNYAIQKEIYNSFIVERSIDGTNYKNISNFPLTGLNNSDRTNQKRIFYIDSIVNNKTYHYRVKGITPFGEISPPSEVVSGIGKMVLPYVPRITSKHFLDDKRVILEWEFVPEGNAHIKEFQLNRSHKVNGKYTTVMKNIPPDARKILYDSLQPTNYFTLTAIGKQGSNRTSYPALVQPVDSIPPVKPIQVQGKIDSLGIVSLQWKANIEKDMLGYRVFRGNNKEEEYSQITVSPHKGTSFYDSISVKNLNSNVFYKIIAVDQRFNMSEASDILTIKKPDFIPPTQPVFKNYVIKNGEVFITWAKSSSNDIQKHELYRKEQDDWELINTQKNLKPAVQRLSSYVHKKNGFIELYWKAYTEPNVAELIIYKGKKGEKTTLLKHTLPNTKRITDYLINPNNEYSYSIRAVFKDGTLGKWASILVNY